MKKLILAAVATTTIFAASAPAFAGYWAYGSFGVHYVRTWHVFCGPFVCRWFLG